MKLNQTQIIVVVLLGALVLTGGGMFKLATQDIGYSTGFQGPKAKFKGIEVMGKQYTTGLGPFDTTLRFDPDEYNKGKPDLIGEMTSVFVPKESLGNIRAWVPTAWLSRIDTISNPQATYSWNISGKTYKMEQWVLKWYLSISAEGQGAEVSTLHPLQPWILGTTQQNIYTDTEIWFEFDLTPTWYIEGGGTAYFAVGKVMLSDWKKEVKDNEGRVYTSDTSMSFSPSSGMLYLYYGMWGVGQASEQTAYTFQGKQLNPDLFRDKLYAHFDLNNFGIRSWIDFPSVRSKGDVVTVGFDVTVFVIGEWDVKDITTIPEDWGRTVKTTTTGPSLAEILGDPRFQAAFGLFLMIGIFILILLVAPWILVAIVSLFTGRRRR